MRNPDERRQTLIAALLFILTSIALPTAASPYDGLSDHPCPSADDSAANRRETDWPWICRYREDNRHAQERRIDTVYMGDSITEFWQRESPQRFNEHVIDRGISGQTSPQMVLRFQQDVIALKPRVVAILAGTNDVAANSGPEAFEDVIANLDTMVVVARAHGVIPVLGTVPPAATFWWRKDFDPRADITRLNGLIRRYAQDHGVALVDYHAALRNDNDGLGPEYADDGVHPNAAGYRVMEHALDLVLKML